jgi:HPt (histidine-containing phosphotransfer) domain-containing protein
VRRGDASAREAGARRPAPADAIAREALLALAEGDAEFLRDLVETFAADAAARLAEVREALARGEPAAALRPAHTLAGTVGNFEAGPALAAARRLLERARAGGVEALAAACWDAEREIEALLPALRRISAAG